MPNWVFERQTRDGGAVGEAVPNAVEAGGWSSSEELLVREAIQNSVDAGIEGKGPVKISFRLHQHAEKQKMEMLNDLQLNAFVERAGVLKLPSGNVIEKHDDPLTPLNLLYIEDRNTTGLGGGLADRIKGNFFRLLFLIGDGSKGDTNDGSGGSFGFGKGVYAYNSNIRTIFVFSVFEPTEETKGEWARLLGCSYLPSHDHEDQSWTGRAWFGVPTDGSDSSQAPFPVTNEEACELAKRLGFSSRDKGDYGTSILVVGSDSIDGKISLDRIKSAAETWWWPRLTDGKLGVELIEQDVRHPGLNPADRLDLQPYIKIRNCLLERDRDELVTIPPFRGARGLQLGKLGLMAIPPDNDSFEPLAELPSGSDQGKTPAHRTIAYIRQPGMVVTYQGWSINAQVSAIGVFQADVDIDRHLKLSEPVEHDRWDHHSRRLSALVNGAELVEKVQRKCKNGLKDFIKNLQPPPPPPRGGLEWLGKLLGQILMPRDQTPPEAPTGERGAVSIHTNTGPVTEKVSETHVILHASYAIGLKATETAQEAKVTVSPRLYALEGDNGTRGEILPISISTTDGNSATGEKPELDVTITGAKRHIIEITSEPYPNEWAVTLQLETNATLPEAP